MKKLILPIIIAAPLAVSPIGVFAADVVKNCIINSAGNIPPVVDVFNWEY